MNPNRNVAYAYTCNPVCQLVPQVAPDLLRATVYFAWSTTTMSQPQWDWQLGFGAGAAREGGPHAEADLVMLDGPVLPADAKPARYIAVEVDRGVDDYGHRTWSMVGDPHWRLYEHMTVDSDTHTVTQTGALTWFDPVSYEGWSLPFSFTNNYTDDLQIDERNVLINGPTGALTFVPEVPMTVALWLGLIGMGVAELVGRRKRWAHWG